MVFKKTKLGLCASAFRMLAFLIALYPFFFYHYIVFINTFENCLNIWWVGVLSVQVLRDARRRLAARGIRREKSL